LALIQLAVTANKADNIRRATELIANASKQGAQLISLPVSIYHIYTENYNIQPSI